MNKKDIVLCISIIIISLVIYIMYNLQPQNASKVVVYYENSIVLEADLNINSEYTVKGYNGDVSIIVKDNKVKVSDEISPYHLCSRQGYISKSYETIICLPNKIVINIENSDEIDTIAR